MLTTSEVIDITGYPLISLEKKTDGHYPFPRTRYGILPYYMNHADQIVWGCIESNRVGPITFAPAAGTQDIIAIKNDQRFVLEAGKPLPRLDIEGVIEGAAFRGQVYQDAINCLTANGFKIYLENPLATAIHEAHEEHGIDLRHTDGHDTHLLKIPLDVSTKILTDEYPDVAALSLRLVELSRYDSIALRRTDKIDKKMRRNFNRAFYEQGCWLTLAAFKQQYLQEQEKFSCLDNYSPVSIQLITETFKAFRLNLALLENIESSLLAERRQHYLTESSKALLERNLHACGFFNRHRELFQLQMSHIQTDVTAESRTYNASS